MNKFILLVVLIASSLFSSAQVKDQGGSSNNNSGLKTGSEYALETGYVFGVGNNSKDYLKLNAMYGYRFTPCVSLALGTGLSYNLTAEDALIPLFTTLKVNLINKSISPYLDLGFGYSFDITKSIEIEGVYPLLNLGAGMRFKLKDKYALNVGIGYDKQRYKSGNIVNTEGIGVKVGFSF